ncbi:hypothetical protein ACLBXX_16480 [Microbacterium sp. C23T]
MTDQRMPQPGDPAKPEVATPGTDPAEALTGDPDATSRSLSERGTSETKRTEDPGDLDSATSDAAARVPPEAPARPAGPTVSSVSPDVDLAQDASPLPGAHRGGFQRLPTAPVAVTVETAPAEPGGEFTPDATSWTTSDSAFHRGLAGWSLGFAILGLLVSMFVGWGFPIGLVAVVSAIIALRRPLESRAVAVWAIVLGTLSILYSAGWLLYAAARANIIG